MTTRVRNSIHFALHPAQAWKDALVVTFLVALVGAFLLQVAG